ncbi:MAG TPA: calcium-binding protein [Planctomycetota bacterium]|nr:calcium-binding protein [Planctomycetota bacterium]
MKIHFTRSFAVAALGTLAIAQAPTVLVHVSSGGIQGNGAAIATPTLGVSDDGSVIAFASAASNLVAGDANGVMDIFVRDRALSTTELVSCALTGVPGNALSQSPTASDDGRYVAFESTASNLVAADGNGQSDVFLRDRLLGTTTRLSEPQGGGDANGASSDPFVSGNGRFVSFSSMATNLVPNDLNARADIFVLDLTTGAIVLASIDTNGVQGNLDSRTSCLSDDGTVVAFTSNSTNLWPNDGNGHMDTFVRDLTTNTTVAASLTPAGSTASNGTSSNLAISGDGAFVAFSSRSQELGSEPNRLEIYVYDRVAATTTLVSRSFMGVQSGGSDQPSLSDDGRYVAFHSDSNKLVNLDFGPKSDIFVVDLTNGEVTRASMDMNGDNAVSDSTGATLSGDGRCVAYASAANDLVPNDLNSTWDVFAHDLTRTQPVAYCWNKTSGQGCTPFVFPTGVPSASQPNGFQIEGRLIKTNAPGLLIYGGAPNNAPFLDGTLCVLPPIRRGPPLIASGTGTCGGTFQFDFNTWIAGGSDPALSAGDVVYAQYWFRDTVSPPFFAGLTDAVRFVIEP